jgi:hypothetical protein
LLAPCNGQPGRHLARFAGSETIITEASLKSSGAKRQPGGSPSGDSASLVADASPIR